MPSVESQKEPSAHSYVKNGREIAVAKLIKRSTSDQLLEVLDEVTLGTKYIVYRDQVLMEGLHKPTGTLWVREMYEVVDGGWLPVEMLEIVT